MNTRIIAIFAVIILLVAGGIYFAQSVQKFAEENHPQPSTQKKEVESAADTKKIYPIEEVATHKDAQSCWVAIDGKVYDLTDWINEHPGGPDRILGICGTDASEAFKAQHSGAPKPADQLTSFHIGGLSAN